MKHRELTRNLLRSASVLLWALLGPSDQVHAQPYAYVAGSWNLVIIDTANDTIAATLPIEGYEGSDPRGVAVSPDGQYLYVMNPDGGSIRVIESDLHVFVNTFAVCDEPIAMAFAPLQHEAYVTCLYGGFLAVFDTLANVPAAPIAIDRNQFAIAITPDGSRAVITNPNLFGPSTVSVLDLGSRTVIGSVAVGVSTRGLALTPDGTMAYVTNQNSDSVSLIDLGNNDVIDTIPVSGGPIGIAITPNGATAYITNQLGDTVAVLDTATRQIVARIPVGRQPIAIAITRTGGKAYAVNSGSNTVSVIDTVRNAVTTTIPAGGNGIVIAPEPGDACTGDCDGRRVVTVNEIVKAVNIAMGQTPVDACSAADLNGDGRVTIDEIMQATRFALFGCPVQPVTPRPTLSPTPTTTPGENGCARVCDGRSCTGRCEDGSPHLGYCELTTENGCECVPFECPHPCALYIDPVTSPWKDLSQTLTGTVGANSFGFDATITGGAETVFVSVPAFGPFSAEVPLQPGLNSLTVYTYHDYPPCSGPIRTDAYGHPLDIFVDLPTPTPTPSPTPPAGCSDACTELQCDASCGDMTVFGSCARGENASCRCVPSECQSCQATIDLPVPAIVDGLTVTISGNTPYISELEIDGGVEPVFAQISPNEGRADYHFSAVVPLRPGPNHLRLIARRRASIAPPPCYSAWDFDVVAAPSTPSGT